MANGTCSVEGCELPHRARGYCNAHAARVYRTGDPGPAVIKTQARLVGKPCGVDGCERLVEPKTARGLCQQHYWRWRTYGDVNHVEIIRVRGTESERFWARVDKSGDCWLWTGAVNSDGYGSFAGSATRQAHRFAYEESTGPLPSGTEIDHLCHTRDFTCVGVTCQHRRCVNPAHLEPVVHRENVLRGNVARFTRT